MAKAASKPPTLTDDMKALLDLLGRTPTPARVESHMDRLLKGWHVGLDPDTYEERLDSLRESLAEGIEQAAEAATDVDPASKAEARDAHAAVEAMRIALRAVRAAELAPA